MKKSEKNQKTAQLNSEGVLFISSTVLMMFFYGGFFENAIILCGTIAAITLIAKKKTISISLTQVLFIIFSIWYFICSLQNGFVIEYAAKGLFPFVVLLYWIWSSSLGESKEKIKDIVIEISVWIAAISTLHCIFISIDAGRILRAVFPFDYSNACGIYFAVCFFAAEQSNEKFLYRCKYIFVIALVLTQSVGAAGIFFPILMFRFVSNKKYFTASLTFLFIVFFAFVFYNRITESVGTFLERILHMHDGIMCVKENPIMGIGSGWWEHAKAYFQSGFYSALTIHSSVVSIAVNSGILGIVFFLCVCYRQIKVALQNRESLLLSGMIVVHCIFDFTLSFLLLTTLLVLFLPHDTKEFYPKFRYKNIVLTTAIISFAFLGTCLLYVGAFCNNANIGAERIQLLENYKNNPCIQYSIKANQCMGAILYEGEIKSDILLQKEYKYMPTEMILYRSLSQEGGYLLNNLQLQPYNITLREYALSRQHITKTQSRQVKDTAQEKASFWGRKLYYLKGENQ